MVWVNNVEQRAFLKLKDNSPVEISHLFHGYFWLRWEEDPLMEELGEEAWVERYFLWNTGKRKATLLPQNLSSDFPIVPDFRMEVEPCIKGYPYPTVLLWGCVYPILGGIGKFEWVEEYLLHPLQCHGSCFGSLGLGTLQSWGARTLV